MKKMPFWALLIAAQWALPGYTQSFYDYQVPNNVGTWTGGIHFFNDEVGWACAIGGNIHRTTDGGATWQTVNYGGANDLNDIFFIDDKVGWAVGTGGTALKSTDGGATWATLNTSTTLDLSDVVFVDAQRGWAAAGAGFGNGNNASTVFRTTDGGTSWTAVALPAPGRNANALDFVNANIGYVACDARAVYKTVDGGLSWMPIPVPTALPPVGNHTFYALDALDANTVVVAGTNNSFYRTTDGGATWQAATGATGTVQTRGLCFWDATQGLAVGNGGRALTTSDGGATWTPVQPLPAAYATYALHACAAPSPSAIYVGGQRGIIAKSADGGLTWSIGTYTDIAGSGLAIAFQDEASGIAGGSLGSTTRLLQTTNGGNTWSVLRAGIPGTAIEAVEYVGPNTVLVANANGTASGIFRSTDNGQSFQPTVLTGNPPASVSNACLDIFKVNNDLVVGCGQQGRFFKSVNGGANWTVAAAVGYAPNFKVVGMSPTNCGGANGSLVFSGLDPNTTYAVSYSKNYGPKTAPGFYTANASGTLSIPGLSAGVYNSFEVNLNGCKGTSNTGIALADPGAPTFNVGTTPPSSCGSATGQIALTGTGATGLLANTTYSVSYWHNGTVVGPTNYTTNANRQILLTGLAAGVYASISVSTNTCVRPTTAAALVQDPGTTAFTIEATAPSVCDGSDGGIVLANLAPNTTYSFRFTSNGNEANPISAATDANGFFAVGNLSAGIYQNLRVTNLAGCLRVAEGVAISDRSSPDLHAVHFVNEKVGYMVGDHGTVLKTANGGTTWLLQPIPSPTGSAADLNSVFFSDEQNGHCCGLGGSIYTTTDGGNTWARYSATPFPGNPSFQKIHFYDKNNGIVFSNAGATYVTKNGGNTWAQQFNIVPDALYDAFILNRKVGYVAGTANDGFTIAKMEQSCFDLFAATTKPSVKISIGLNDPFDCYSTADSIAATEACKFKGVAWLSAKSFDDGSYDLCGPVKLTLRRMPKHFKQVNGVAVPVYNDVIESLNKEDGYSPCQPNDGTVNSTSEMFLPGTPLANTGFDPFGPTCTPGFKPWKPTEYQRAWLEQDSVKFYSDEVGTRDTVILRIYEVGPSGCPRLDGSGNYVYNETLIAVDIVDRIRPTCMAPAHVTVSCENFDPSLWAYGQAKVEDNCCLDMDKIYRGQCGLRHSVNYARFDSACNKGTIVRSFSTFDCSGNSSLCTQRVIVTYTSDDYYIRFPDDRIVTSCAGATYGEPVLFGVDCELTNITFRDDTFTIVPDACYKVERTWTVINWCTYDPNCSLTRVINPTPNAQVNHASNLPGPIVSNINGCDPATLNNPWRSACVRINPTDASATNYTRFWQMPGDCLPTGSKFNGYRYLQIIKIVDGLDPVAQCTQPDGCDVTDNDPNFWNVDYWWDPTYLSHDLYEMPIDLKLTATDACSGSRLNFRYLLFLDLDANSTLETVVSSANLPPVNTVFFGNVNNPNYTGGQPRAFDHRLVINPSLDWYRFALQVTRSGMNATAAVRFNSVRQQNNYVLPQIPRGKHRIKWIVEDGCGNETVCEQNFEIKDCKAPTVFCKPLVVNLLPTGTITLWAPDFLDNALDNYTPIDQLSLAVSTGEPAPKTFPRDPVTRLPITSVPFSCDHLGINAIQLWAEDRAGNVSSCQTELLVQNGNLASCEPKPTVAGALKTESDQSIVGADVKLSVTHPAFPPFDLYQRSDYLGNYQFRSAVPVAGNYTVTPEKTDNPLNGVTTLDLALINKHILGTEPLNTPYKIIAADANKSGTITTFDAVELRKLILGIYDELPGTQSWRFVKKEYVFSDPANPFALAFPESSQFSNIQADRLDENFVGIKIGDVNNTAMGNNLVSADDRTLGTALFDLEDRAVKAGEVFEATFKSAGRVPVYQFTINHTDLEVLDILPGAEMGLDNFGVFAKDAAITTSWNGDAPQTEFMVKFRATQNGQLSKMLGVSSRITKAVAYVDGQQQDVAFRFHNGTGSVVSSVGFELYQNTPNPFVGKTVIGFHLPEASDATLSVYDEAGKLLHHQESAFAKGFNHFVLEHPSFPKAGLLYYTVATPKYSATRKMIQILGE